MALTNVTISFDLAQILGADFDPRRTKAYVTTNVESGTLMDTTTGETRLGDQAVTIAADGTGSFTTWAPGADGNPVSWQTSLVVDYPRTGQRDRKRRVFGPWTIAGTTKTVATKALTANVATIGTTEAHGLMVGNTVTVAGVDATFNGTYTITAVPSATSFSYAKTAANVAQVAATGTVTSPNVLLTTLEEEQAVPAEYLTSVTTALGEYVANAQGHAASAAGSVSLVAWAPAVAYSAGDVRQAPDGSTVRRNTNGTSAASFDTAPLAAPVLAAPTTATTGGTIAAGATYFYRATALNALGETLGSTEVSRAIAAALATPTGVSIATATTGGSLAPGTFSYRVSATNTLGETLASTAVARTIPAALAAPVLAAPTTATTGGTLAAATYFYKITAVNAIGETVGSNEVSQATTGTTSTVGLSWAAIAGATGYKIYRATTTGGQSTSPALVASVGAVTSYTDTGTAVSAGAVPATNTTSTTTNANTVTWAATTGATGYKVYGRTASGELLIATVGAVTTYTDTGSVTPAGALPTANTTATNTNTVGLSWGAVTGATGYKVYRATVTGGQSTSPALVASVGAVTTYTDTGTAVTAGAVPAAGTTSEKAHWTPVSAVAGTMEQVALSNTYGTPLKDTLNDATFDTLLASLDPGDRVFIPEGVTISLAATHTLTQPVTIDGPGRILDTRVTPTTALFTLPPAASGTRINCPIDGSLSATYAEGHNAIHLAGVANGAGVAPTYVTDVVIDSPRISGFGSFAVRARFPQNCDFLIGEASNLGGGGIFGESTDGVTAHIRRLTDIGPGPGPLAETYGIQFSREDDATDLIRYPHSTNSTGRIDVATNAPLMNMLGCHGGDGLHFAFDTADGIKRVIDIVPSSGDAGTELYAPNNVSFSGGYANSGVADGTGEPAVTIAGAYAGAVVEYAKGISGHIDTLVGYGDDSAVLSGAVYLRTTQGLNVSFGSIREPSPRAVHLYQDNQDFMVGVGNVLDAWSNAQTSADLITFTSNTNKGVIAKLSASRGSKTATYVNTRGVAVIAAAHANTRIRLGEAVDLTATTTKVTGNIYGLIHWDTAQLGMVIDGTLRTLFYAGNTLMQAGEKLVTPAPSASKAGFRLSEGVAPTSSDGGDLWTTSAGSGGMQANIRGTVRRVFTGFEATATLDFPSVAAGASQELTVTVTGAVAADRVALGPPAAIEAGLVWNGYVSAADTVKVRVTNVTAGAIDPASASWKVSVIK